MQTFQMTQKQAVSLQKVQSRKFIVGSIDSQGAFSISVSPTEHDTEYSASQEVNRLASLTPGKAYFWTQLKGGALLPAVTQVVKF